MSAVPMEARPSVVAVIVAYGSGEHLGRALDSFRRAAAVASVEPYGVLLVAPSDSASKSLAARTPGIEVIEVAPGEPATPGANRNRGAARASEIGPELFLFLDGDMELDEGFLARGLSLLGRSPGTAGYGGRIDERHWRAGRDLGGASDLHKVGAGGEVGYLGVAWLCRRSAFDEVGGFDPRLPSEEDFELGLRLRAAGWTLWADAAPAAVHYCEPRPSFAEFARRWNSGMYAGQGLALRYGWGRRGFAELLARQRLFVGALVFLLLGIVASVAALLGQPRPLLAWLLLVVAAWALLWLRKRSPKLAVMSLLTWAVQGVALARAWLFGPWGPHARASGGGRRSS